MFWIFNGLVLFSISISTLMYLLTQKNHKKHHTLLVDLGLAKRWNREETTPFYKWGWRKASGERVWGERIVRKAFEKAEIWLTPEDLAFFEKQCRDNSAGHTINEDKVRDRVEIIINRNDHLTSHVMKIIREVIQYVMSVTKSEAEMLLANLGVKEREAPLQQLLKLELKRKLRQAGLSIMGIDSKGMNLKSDKGEFVYKLKGFDGWSQWINVFERECIAQLSRRSYPPYDKVLQSVKKSVQNGLFSDFKNDITEARKFRTALSQEIQSGVLRFQMNDVEQLDSILYSWKFNDKIPFRFNDHKHLRELILKRDLSPRFREIIVQQIQPDSSSLLSLARFFPRYVIFYGHNSKARKFASEQYINHIDRLMDILPTFTHTETNPPALVRIREKNIQQAREEADNLLNSPHSLLDTLRGETPEVKDMEPYLLQFIQKEKQKGIVDRNLTKEEAEEQGWIIDMGMDDPTEFELEQLTESEYSSYYRINCDGPGDIDFESNSFNAKQQRIYFFNMILDSLTGVPEIDTTSAEERLGSGVAATEAEE